MDYLIKIVWDLIMFIFRFFFRIWLVGLIIPCMSLAILLKLDKTLEQMAVVLIEFRNSDK